MPTKIVADLIERLDTLDRKLEAHLIEGTGVKNDIVWLKYFVMGIAGGIGTIVVTLFVYVLKK